MFPDSSKNFINVGYFMDTVNGSFTNCGGSLLITGNDSYLITGEGSHLITAEGSHLITAEGSHLITG